MSSPVFLLSLREVRWVYDVPMFMSFFGFGFGFGIGMMFASFHV